LVPQKQKKAMGISHGLEMENLSTCSSVQKNLKYFVIKNNHGKGAPVVAAVKINNWWTTATGAPR
jgi:hypothetical protein